MLDSVAGTIGDITFWRFFWIFLGPFSTNSTGKVALPINFHGLQIERNFVEICLMGQGCSKKNLGVFYYVLARHEDF